jgi:hypothetical protein
MIAKEIASIIGTDVALRLSETLTIPIIVFILLFVFLIVQEIWGLLGITLL